MGELSYTSLTPNLTASFNPRIFEVFLVTHNRIPYKFPVLNLDLGSTWHLRLQVLTMRLQAVVVVTALLTLTTSHFEPKPDPSLPNLDTHPPPSQAHLLRRVDLAFEWNKAWCKGAKLAQAMIKSEAQVGTCIDPARSPWDGDLVSAFAAWGYGELPHYRDGLCDFGKGQHELQRAFAEMGIGTQSAADGGPNICYHVEHQNGPSVERDPSGEFPPMHRQFYLAKERRLRVSFTKANTSCHIRAST
jgi:hypothetical protein